MPIKMTVLRPYYHKPEGKEYAAGATLTVASEAEAERLEKFRKATRASKKDAPAPAAKVQPTSETPPQVQTASMKAEATGDANPQAPSPVGRYRRRDLTPES